jgi:hypothetical protein
MNRSVSASRLPMRLAGGKPHSVKAAVLCCETLRIGIFALGPDETIVLTVLLPQAVEFLRGGGDIICDRLDTVRTRFRAFLQSCHAGNPLENAPPCIQSLKLLRIRQL